MEEQEQEQEKVQTSSSLSSPAIETSNSIRSDALKRNLLHHQFYLLQLQLPLLHHLPSLFLSTSPSFTLLLSPRCKSWLQCEH
eukprot:760195-Hanusia_phi.AAC.2